MTVTLGNANVGVAVIVGDGVILGVNVIVGVKVEVEDMVSVGDGVSVHAAAVAEMEVTVKVAWSSGGRPHAVSVNSMINKSITCFILTAPAK